jgi:DHA1 family bicyclomycin/chloramphenicol resistance-like MFS transporter
MRLLQHPVFRRDPRAPFILLATVTATGTLGMHMIIPALPATAIGLGVSASTIQLTITLYLVGLAVGQLVYGPISDLFGRRPVLLFGLALFTLAGAVAAMAPNAGVLIGARVLQSIGGCGGLVLGRAIVRDQATAAGAAAQLALLTLVMSMAPAIAPVIGGYTTALVGWRACFGLLAVLGVAAWLLILFLLPETLEGRGSRRGFRFMLHGSVSLLRSRTFRGYAIGGSCTTTAFYGFMSASPFIFHDLLHQPTQAIGLYYVVLMGGVALGGFSANRLAGRVPARVALRIANGVAIVAAVAFMVADLTDHLSVWTVIAPVTVFMVGAGMASPFAISGAVSVNPQAIGAASGLYGFMQMGYGMLCTIVVEVWRPGAVFPVAVVLLVSAVLGQVALATAARGA